MVQQQDVANAMYLVRTTKTLVQRLRDVGFNDLLQKELNNRFNEKAMELISLSCALDPKKNMFHLMLIGISELAKKYYPGDFTEQEMGQLLQRELRHFGVEVSENEELKDLSSIIMLCQWMVDTGKSKIYPLIFRLVSLVLTLHVSTATNERAFSATKIVKSRLRNKMADDYLTNTLLLYIERETVYAFVIDAIINDFRDLKERKLFL